MQSWNPNFGYSEKDASGQEQFIAPYTVDDKGRMSVNIKSFMAPALRGLAGVYGFDKITKDGTVPGANPFDLQQRAYDLTDRNAQRKFDREKPPVQQDVVAYTTNMPMFKPGEILIDRAERDWCINDIRDYRIDYAKPVFKKDWTSIRGSFPIDKVLDTTVIDFNKDWTQLESLRDKFLIVRLILDNLHDVQLITNFSITDPQESFR